MKINDIFTKEQYAEAFKYAEENNYIINYIGISQDQDTVGQELFQIAERDTKKENLIRIENQVNVLKQKLLKTDYIVLKISELESEEDKESLRLEYAEQLSQRKQWRKEINALEEEIKSIIGENLKEGE